jgi:hypothetical protein
MIIAAASKFEPTKGVNESDLTEVTELVQKWNPISGRGGADASKQALIERLAHITAVMARTNMGKAAEFARALSNLCSARQPITTRLKRFEPRSNPREHDDNRSGAPRYGCRGRGYGPPTNKQNSDPRSGGGSGRSEASQKHSSSATASKESSIERNMPPGIRIPEGRLLTPEENPREKRARLSRSIQERLGPLPGANPSPMNTDASNPIQATDGANPRSYKLQNRVVSPGKSNDTITIPSC